MKLKGKPLLFRTIIGEVAHKGKVYQVTIREDLTENHLEVWKLDEIGSLEAEINPDSYLGKELVEFFLIETEDIEQFN
jgi:hypothetical protein